MVTKYDVRDEVVIKAKVHKVFSDTVGEIKYMLDIPNTPNYATYTEDEIISKIEEHDNGSK